MLSAAGQRILDRWDEKAGAWMATRAEAACAIAEILARISTPQAPTPDGESEAAHDRPLLSHRLAEALKLELLREWKQRRETSGALYAAPVLDDLLALEEYRSRGWPGGGEDLVSRLSQPDALELVVGVGHDLRSPLNSVLFLSEVLRSGYSGPVNEQQQKQLGLVYSATLGMISITNDIMVAASDGKGLMDEEPGPFSIGVVFKSVSDLVLPMAEEKGVALEFHPPEYDRCHGHQSSLGRALLNLTTNALKFTDVGKVVVSATRVDREQIEFSVQDAGRGIPEDRWDELFHPFQKSAARSGHFFAPGGLGLSIARRLVVSMGSKLQFTSVLGSGTRFFFSVRLPPAPVL